MIDLQELIIRARFVFSGAPKRFDVFKLVNGKNSTKDIAKKTGRSLSSVLQDIEKLKDFGLIQTKRSKECLLKKDGAMIFEKVPLIKHVPASYFKDVADTSRFSRKRNNKIIRNQKRGTIHIPSEKEILDICNDGENQLYEFKSPGIKMEDLSEEIAAFLHTKNGGIIFYGIDNEGTILGTDMKRQDFDQRLHNSIRNTIDPPPNIDIKEKVVMGTKIILVIIPAWDRKTLYQYRKKERYLIRRGANKFGIKPDEIKKLSKGEYVV